MCYYYYNTRTLTQSQTNSVRHVKKARKQLIQAGVRDTQLFLSESAEIGHIPLPPMACVKRGDGEGAVPLPWKLCLFLLGHIGVKQMLRATHRGMISALLQRRELLELS